MLRILLPLLALLALYCFWPFAAQGRGEAAQGRGEAAQGRGEAAQGTGESSAGSAALTTASSPCLQSDGFDFPVGTPHAGGYYNAQGFGVNDHLGEDWNGNGGSNTDLGDSVHALAAGIVVFSEDIKGGWGNVVRVRHDLGTSNSPRYVESIYAHLDEIHVKRGQCLDRGQLLGTIGTANGKYLAHLHLEIRDTLGLAIGPGYASDPSGRVHPTEFIRAHRPDPDDL